jgi:integrase
LAQEPQAGGRRERSVHDLRHAHASILISAGCSVKAVSAALGHASAATTLGINSHLWGSDDDRLTPSTWRCLRGLRTL